MKILTLVWMLLAVPFDARAAQGPGTAVSAWLMLPFVILLLAIALGPLLNPHWWERYYPHVSLGLGCVVFFYYVSNLNPHRIFEAALDYFSFIALIGSLFVVAGGIYLHTDRQATPLINTAFLAAGAVISNLLGTTGASMLLIRPFIRANQARIREFHVVFFIFVVSNVGGVLTPVADPPLFLGYLNGVPFHWAIFRLWHIWLVALLLILTVFFIFDSLAYQKWLRERRPHIIGEVKFEFLGTQNLFFLVIILTAVFAATPAREIIMISAAAASFRFARKDALKANGFNFHPIQEVAFLFAGIFITMVPALDWLSMNAHGLGITTPGQFYWAAGILSSFLDNAPTYLTFLAAALGLNQLTLGNPGDMKIFLDTHGRFLEAISIAAVFFGANTYIGNGPNFMVKSIAERAGVPCPSFAGYMVKYSIPVLIPILGLIWFLFFRQAV